MRVDRKSNKQNNTTHTTRREEEEEGKEEERRELYIEEREEWEWIRGEWSGGVRSEQREGECGLG